MSRSNRDHHSDASVQQVLDVLAAYDDPHPHARIEAYRQNSASIRIRILDPDFQGIDRIQREDTIWELLGRLPEGLQSQITQIVLLTPDEASFSFASFEFENPLPSNL
jgi:stress-induced morphogen